MRLINEGSEDPLADLHVKGTPALRTLALVRRMEGNDGVGRVYQALGDRVHEGGEELSPDVVRSALSDVGLRAGLLDEAIEDDTTMKEVRAEHDLAVEEVGCFGVPTIVLESGKGMFGPVIATVPTGEHAGEMWDHFAWLTEQDGFFELKRERKR